MSNDVFESWRDQRFIIAPTELIEKLNMGESLVILTDYRFWSEHSDEFIEWLNERKEKVVMEGMTVVFGDDATLTEFVLRWS